MKKKGKMIACLIVLIVLLAVLILVNRMNRENDGDDQTEKETIEVTSADEDSVTALSFRIDGQEVSFTKNGDNWTYDQDPEFPLDQSSVENIVGKVVSLSAEQELEDDSLNLTDYGLDDPTNVVTFTDENGTTKITIGAENTTTGIWYLYLNDDTDKIYLVDQNFDSMFPDDIMSFAEGESLPTITASNITDIQVENGDDSYQLSRDSEDLEWTITDATGFSHEADADKADTLTSTFASLSYGGMLEYNCTDMAQYGLAQPAATIKIHYTEEQTVNESTDTDDEDVSANSDASDSENLQDTSTDSSSDSASDTEEETTVTVEKDLILLVGNQNDSGNYYVTTEGSKEVHTITDNTMDTILNLVVSDYWDLEVSPVTVTDIKSMDVTYHGQTNTIVRNTEETTDEDGNTTQNITYTWNGEEVDKTEASTLYSQVVTMNAQSKDRSLEKTADDELIVVMHTDSGDYTVSYSPYDSSFYYVKDLEGVPSLVNKNNVNDLIDAYLTVIGEK